MSLNAFVRFKQSRDAKQTGHVIQVTPEETSVPSFFYLGISERCFCSLPFGKAPAIATGGWSPFIVELPERINKFGVRTVGVQCHA